MSGKSGRPRVFIDADVLFAGAASPNEYSASLVLLRMAEITLIEALTSVQVITEVERNLQAKMATALPAFRLLVSRCLFVVPDPNSQVVEAMKGAADPKDLPILVAAHLSGCKFLATYNLRDFRPGLESVVVLKPGDLVQRIRYLLAQMSGE